MALITRHKISNGRQRLELNPSHLLNYITEFSISSVSPFDMAIVVDDILFSGESISFDRIPGGAYKEKIVQHENVQKDWIILVKSTQEGEEIEIELSMNIMELPFNTSIQEKKEVPIQQPQAPIPVVVEEKKGFFSGKNFYKISGLILLLAVLGYFFMNSENLTESLKEISGNKNKMAFKSPGVQPSIFTGIADKLNSVEF